MNKHLHNLGYFLRETRTLLRINGLSNIFSLLSMGLIFFLLAMVLSGWWASNQIIEAIQGEAEVNIYFEKSLDNAAVVQLVEAIREVNGVRQVSLIREAEAQRRMEEILGKEASVLSYLEENPFSSFIEVKINIKDIEGILDSLKLIPGIEHIRDNRDILDRLQSVASVLELLGYFIIAAVGVSTIVIIAHIIRLGMISSREQINTLRLLGAPEGFIALPFVLAGMALTVGGGMAAAALTMFSISYVYAQLSGPLPFIPLPNKELLIYGAVVLVLALSAALGLVGSLLGLSSERA